MAEEAEYSYQMLKKSLLENSLTNEDTYYVHNNIVHILKMAGLKNEAIKECEVWIEKFPKKEFPKKELILIKKNYLLNWFDADCRDSTKGLGGRLSCFVRRGEIRSAFGFLNEAIDDFTTEINYRQKNDPFKIDELYLLRAKIYFEQTDFERTLLDLNEAIKSIKFEYFEVSKEKLLKLYRFRGLVFFNLYRYQEAKLDFSSAILLVKHQAEAKELTEMLAQCDKYNLTNNFTNTRRIALIIGNDQYEHYDPLKEQPLNDAEGVETRLKALNFEVVKQTNLSREGIRKAVIDFKKQAKGYDVVLFFFAGHGMGYGDKNYLIPTDAEEPESESELDEVLFPLETIVKLFGDLDGKWNIFWIDACRNSPKFSTRGKPTGNIGTAETDKLQQWQKTRGKNVCFFFGTAQGEYAHNSKEGTNGIFTTALLKHLQAGVELNDLHHLVTAETEKASGYKQLPYVQAKMTENLKF